MDAQGWRDGGQFARAFLVIIPMMWLWLESFIHLFTRFVRFPVDSDPSSARLPALMNPF